MLKRPELISCNNVTSVFKEIGEDSEKLSGIPEGFGPLYRLDRPVSGIMLLVRPGHDCEVEHKDYYLVCKGDPGARGIMEDLLYHDPRQNRSFPVKKMRKGVKSARLSYETIAYDKDNDLSLVKACLDTGRTHQIRCQFASRGMPLAGDGRYGSRIKCDIALICKEVGFTSEGKEYIVSVELPGQYPWTLFKA